MDSIKVKKILYNLAKEISLMSEEEKILHIERLVHAEVQQELLCTELQQEKKIFWNKIAKKMLVDEVFNKNILLRFSVDIH